MSCDVIVAINVFENHHFLLGQLENIDLALKADYRVLLHCSVSFHEEISQDPRFSTNPRLHICPQPFDKKRFHGSLLQGQIACMKEAREHFDFETFMILSSRTFFHRPLTLKEAYNTPKHQGFEARSFPTDWWWPDLSSTKLCKWVRSRPNPRLGKSRHEGLALPRQSVDFVLSFGEKFPTIFEDLFNFDHCVEEMAIQTILSNAPLGNYYYWDWGSDADEYIIKAGSFVWKVDRTPEGLRRAKTQLGNNGSVKWMLFFCATFLILATLLLT